MQFELNPALIDDILFAMENQNTEFMFDTQTGHVVTGTLGAENGRYSALPQWTSADGYRIMEHWTLRLTDASLVRHLTIALNRGKGVFRAFKEVLKQYPEAEAFWLLYKTHVMKQVIFEWYNDLREVWGLERVGVEPEETVDLLLEDFVFRQNESGFIVETSRGERAGHISIAQQGAAQHIRELSVEPEYRGLGLGEALLGYFLDHADAGTIFIDLPAESEQFARVLVRRSFDPYITRYRLIKE